MNKNIKRNIPLLFIIQSLRWFLMIMPIVVVFFQENGLSLFQVMVVQAVFSLSMLLFEIPSGYFSDKIGRRITMIIGLAFSSAGFIIIGSEIGFVGFILGEILLGIGASFISGTDSSLLYDTLLILDIADSHHKREGFYMSIGNYSESVASILGGIIAVYSMQMNFFIEGSLMFLAAVVAIFLIEPEIKREGKKSLNFRSFLFDIKKIFSNKKTLYLVSFGAMSGLGTFLALWYIQPEMVLRGMPIAFFGIIWAGLNILVGVFSNISHKLPKTSKPINVLAIFPFVITLSYFSLIFLNGYWILLGFLGFYIVRGLKGPLERNLLHKSIDSQSRATVLSVQSMLMRISFTVLGPLFALLARENTNSYIYLVIGILFLILSILNLSIKNRITI